MRFKKNGTLAVADLALTLIHERVDQIKRSGQLPEGAQYTFDELKRIESDNGTTHDECQTIQVSTTVLKTTGRTVVTLRHGTFAARHVVRKTKAQDGATQPLHSSQLARLVAPRCKYGYDLLAHVGLESFLHGRRLEEIQKDLQQRSPSILIGISSLDDLRRRFLFYLGKVHREAVSPLRKSLGGQLTWLIDGTLEPGTPVFFGIQDARSAILLGSWKIPTESTDNIAPCLREAARDYGVPERVLHDLSSAMSLACETAFSGVPHDVCHFHFARDVGEDILTQPQKALSSRLRSLKLQVRLREQRKTQTEWLREHADAPEAVLVLQRLLQGESFTGSWTPTLGREVLLAFHFWMLDYAADGGRQGFPFDPYFLYFHRRLIRGHDALVQLLSRPAVSALAPKALWNLRDHLQRYRNDPKIIDAADHYEIAFQEFHRLRTALRLGAGGTSPMHHGYELTGDQQHELREALDALCQEYRQRIEGCSNEVECGVCAIILAHVEKYLPQLLPPTRSTSDGVRTTNQLETHWSTSKRACRQTQGRRKLTRLFNALPSELMLLPNLRNQQYVNVVLDGRLDHLASKFAEAHSAGRSYASWRLTNTSLNLGRIPRRLLRQEHFVDRLTETYDIQCQDKHREVA